MNLPISYSKYSTFTYCPLKYIHQYILRTPSEFEHSYPLVLGQLTHLFIKLYNDGDYSKSDILSIKDNLDVLYELIDLKYPSYDNNSYVIKNINIDDNIKKLIEFINDNIVVFFHAVKLFNVYNSSFFPRINEYSTKILSETTFHNIITLNDNIDVCLYGSIDILFYTVNNEKLHCVYISDLKSGKKLYDTYINQLFFYNYNIQNYNYKKNENIKNITDDLNSIEFIKQNMNKENMNLILFSLQENIHSNKKLFEVEDKYNLFITKMFDILSNDIYELHKNKDFILIDDMFSKYKDEYNLKEMSDCKQKDIDFLCKKCDYANICEYKKIK